MDLAISGVLLGWAAAAVVAVAGAGWIRRLREVRVPSNRSGFLAAFAVGGALGVASLAAGGGWLGGAPAGFALVVAAIFLGLATISAQAPNEPSVAVGQPVLDFEAPDDEGRTFQLASLAGKPYLLKFFRGHW
ncbi:MAG: hypothetical protein ACQGVK_16270 [Myxococcota bacterium]